jgi:hypothetical protein
MLQKLFTTFFAVALPPIFVGIAVHRLFQNSFVGNVDSLFWLLAAGYVDWMGSEAERRKKDD